MSERRLERKGDDLEPEQLRPLARLPAEEEAGDAHRVLRLQASAGNSAVAGLLLGGGPVGGSGRAVQRQTDGNDESWNGGSDETYGYGEPEMPAETSGLDPETIAAVDAAIDVALDPDTIMSILEASVPVGDEYAGEEWGGEEYGGEEESGYGDYEMPEGSAIQTLRIQRQTAPDQPGPPRPATMGDLLKAVLPYVRPALEWLKEDVKDTWNIMSTGQKVATTMVAAPIAGAAAGLAHRAPSLPRVGVDAFSGMNLIDGLIPGLSLKLQITDGVPRAGFVEYDFAPLLRQLRVPGF